MSKTIRVDDVRKMANDMLANKNVSDEQRKGIYTFLEKILIETGNYNGFGFVEWMDEGGIEKWRAEGEKLEEIRNYLGNETRRFYF